jgi:hypothetical protein
VDYHWEGDLEEKQTQMAAVLLRELLPRVKEEFGYDGTVSPARGPGEDSPDVKTVSIRLYRMDMPGSRIEIPVDITRIQRLDEPVVRTKDGTVFLTLSDRDMIEGKVLAVCNRLFSEIRDLVDIFLFEDYLGEDSPGRIRAKLENASLGQQAGRASVEKLSDSRRRHVAAIQEILDAQMAPQAADRIREGGGAGMLFDRVMGLLRKLLDIPPGGDR